MWVEGIGRRGWWGKSPETDLNYFKPFNVLAMIFSAQGLRLNRAGGNIIYFVRYLLYLLII